VVSGTPSTAAARSHKSSSLIASPPTSEHVPSEISATNLICGGDVGPGAVDVAVTDCVASGADVVSVGGAGADVVSFTKHSLP